MNAKAEPTRTDEMRMEHDKSAGLGTVCGYWNYVITVAVPAGTDGLSNAEVFDRPGGQAIVSANPTVGM